MTIRTAALAAALLGIVVSSTPASAQAPPPPPGTHATFYETTENMRLIAKKKPRRVAESALIGTAIPGNPFCPTSSPPGGFCVLNALGEDDVNLTTGLGTFDAKLTIVVQELSADGRITVDSPETVVAKVRASGKMDFSPAILNGIPYGTITGRAHRVGSDGSAARFVGVFRLPFACGEWYCYLGLDPTTGALSKPVPLAEHEFSIGYPAVRFDVWFQ